MSGDSELIKTNWFQTVLTRLRLDRRNHVVKELECEATESDEQDNFKELPPELLEKIFSFVSQNSTLLTCRLVNRRWNHFVTGLLEKLHHQRWNSWEPVYYSAREVPFTPTLVQNHTKLKNEGFSHLWLSPALKHCKEIEGNPFPANSLRVDYNRILSRISVFNDTSSTIKWKNVFTEFGHCLTSIILDNVRISVSQISLMLSQTPNLRALTLCCVIVHEVPLDHPTPCSVLKKMNKKISTSPHLQTLQILGYNNKKIVNWLLDILSERLLNLKIKLGAHSPEFYLNQTVTLSQKRKKTLQKLSIYIPVHSNDIEWWYELHCSAAVKFICQFSSSVVHLRLCMEFKRLLGFLKREEVVFEKLRTLSLAATEYERVPEENWQDILLKESAGMLLPNLESVMFGDLKYDTF